ncbi:uncharacterized protein [Triticum aestivum]|uniref:uncharacterized protein n=1 Tax=Triticum aestivum TaxID=4565 RepID=UPI001D01D6D5|nr:uncharacterized protein LOC123099611 [Triticum aestivum]
MEITPSLALILVRVAAGDAEKLARLREICSWFRDPTMLYEEAIGIAGCLVDEEKATMRLNHDFPVEYLYWATMDAESDDPVQRYRWRAYKSSLYGDGASHGAGQGADQGGHGVDDGVGHGMALDVAGHGEATCVIALPAASSFNLHRRRLHAKEVALPHRSPPLLPPLSEECTLHRGAVEMEVQRSAKWIEEVEEPAS